jgi:hypothetical protein
MATTVRHRLIEDSFTIAPLLSVQTWKDWMAPLALMLVDADAGSAPMAAEPMSRAADRAEAAAILIMVIYLPLSAGVCMGELDGFLIAFLSPVAAGIWVRAAAGLLTAEAEAAPVAGCPSQCARVQI